ncbi:hypothetical protein ACFY0A_38895 [Streptomyces sp. NPDC001698]|uniref:hypothetical protein n=1 Tax=Streptomyces sp. NPDC001698 TaxID=3364601 RepID=UPI0036C289C5
MTAPPLLDELAHLDDAEVYQRLQAAKEAMAQDLLSDPVTLARGLDATYRVRPHLRVISEALVGLERGEYDRLMVWTPAQVGKSSLAGEWFPFWWLCLHAEDRVAVTSYSDGLAMRRGKAIRRYITEHGDEYDLALLAGSSAAQDYDTTKGGGVRSVSIGSGLTGFPVNCVAGETLVDAPGGAVPIGVYVESGRTDPVLSYDHDRDRPVWAPVLATSISERETLEVLSRSGRVVRCTPEHRFYVTGRGYVAAADLQPGDPLVTRPDDLPRRAPQVEHDAVAVVRPVRGGRVRVYDLQVAGTCNFFAGQVLVHNCLIVDDPHKDRADAESARLREQVHDWWSSAALKRLQPDRNAVVAIQTRWHPDDFCGRRLEEEGRLEDGGRWKVVHLPAIANPSKFGPDPLGRQDGDPLPHPKIPTRKRRALLAWWKDVKDTSTVRDWHAMAQGDPQPAEGALVSRDLLRLIRDGVTAVEPQKIAVTVDPSGGGRDTAGVIGGFLGSDNRVWITHDRSGAMSSAEWSTVACLLAHETNAAVIYVEGNYGRDMCTLAIRTSWEKLQNEGVIPKKVLMPLVDLVFAKQGKLLRAEPIAQQMVQDRVRLRGAFTDLENEWATWQPTDSNSPGRIDASCILVYGLIPEANQGAIAHAPLPKAPQPQAGSVLGQSRGAASVYGRRIGK